MTMDSGTLAAARATRASGLPSVLLSATPGWRREQAVGAGFWFKGSLANGEPAASRLAAAAAAGDTAAVGRLLQGRDGHFALVLEGPGWTLAAVDPVRSVPLIIGERRGRRVLAQEAGPLVDALGLSPADADQEAVLAVALSGFTIGDDTLYRGVRQLGPGQYALFRNDGTMVHARYHQYAPWRPQASAWGALADELEVLTRAVLGKVMAVADGRPIVVPLSGGIDSRLVASGLRELGYPDLRCFAYGLAGNHEAAASRAVAERLGLPWTFVPYTPGVMRRVFSSEDYRRYTASADSLTGIHFPQDYVALRALEAEGWLPGDAVIVNGQSGDFITGNHIPEALLAEGPTGPDERRRRLLESLFAKHYKHWGLLLTEDNRARVGRRLAEEIAAVGGLPDDPRCDYGVYEWCEFQDRQCKYVINGQRLYEFLGYRWQLPLWDRGYLDFWARAPLEAKAHQRLYRELMLKLDWGGVWHDIPINAKTVRPGWLVPLRLFAKALHAPLGRRRWHVFERRVFGYWMDTICGSALVSYRQYVSDRRRPFHGMAFHIERYLATKGLGLDGAALGETSVRG